MKFSFEFCSSSLSGQWETQIASANEWKSKRTQSRLFGYGHSKMSTWTTLTWLKQRIEPFGWDSNDRTYIVLDDNRLYRRTDPPPPPPPTPKPKKNSKKAKAALRASKRRKVSEPTESEADPTEDADIVEQVTTEKEDDGFGGMTWECLAVTLEQFTDFITSIERSRDPNERVLRKRLIDDVLPLLEKQEEARKRKQAQKERELLNLEKLAHAKRSGRIAGKMEQQKREEEAREAERKKQAELAMAKKEQEKWMKLEKERESRMMTREQRLKEREARRILHEEELANLSEDSKKLETGQGRLSERHLKAEIERKKQALEELAEEEDWIFDCICGAYGQIDDGTHSIACDKCNIWQHSKCVGVSQAEADREDFHFICTTCKRRAKDAERAKNQPPIKIKLNRPGSSSSPAAAKQNGSPAVDIKVNGTLNLQLSPKKIEPAAQQHMSLYQPARATGQQPTSWQPDSLSTDTLQGHSPAPTAQKLPQQLDQAGSVAPSPVQRPYSGPYGPYPTTGSPALSPYTAPRPPSAHAFSSPLPHSPTSLPPPAQPTMYTWVNGSSHNVSQQPIPQTTPIQQQVNARYSQVQGSPSMSTNHGCSAHLPQTVNGSRPGSSGGDHRRSSINLPSPLSSAPVLAPINNGYPATNHLVSGSPVLSSLSPHFTKSSPPQASSPFTVHAGVPVQQDRDTGHASALPPAVTGISPTKHSPPRPSTSNGSLGSGTPSVLPPVASLTPSPQHQNLTPPVKASEPERLLPTGQTAP
jgi:PHD-finger